MDLTLIKKLIAEGAELYKCYQSRNSLCLLTHTCHVVQHIAEATPTEIDDKLAAICKLALENEVIASFLAGLIDRLVFANEAMIVGDQYLAEMPETMIAQGISPEMIGLLLKLIWEIVEKWLLDDANPDDVTVTES